MKVRKIPRLISWVLVLLLVMTMVPAAVFADTGWDGSTTSQPSKDGEVWQISNAQELAWFAAEINDGAVGEADSDAKAVLTQDIDLNDKEWTPIGTTENPFSGMLDANHAAIKNLNINGSSPYQGLFGYTKGIIQNLSLLTGKITNTANMTGGVAGQNNGTIKNCNCQVTVTDNSTASSYYGGIVGQNCGIVSECSFAGTVKTGNEKLKQKTFGGIAGYMSGDNAVISGCNNTGEIVGYATESGNTIARFAGIVGNLMNGSVFHCYNTGDVTASTGIVNIRTAGIAARIGDGGKVFNCYNKGKLTKHTDYSGTSTTTGQIYAKNGSHDSAVSLNNYYLEQADDATDEVGVNPIPANDFNTEETIEKLNADNTYGVQIDDSIKYVKGIDHPILAWEQTQPIDPVPVKAVTISGTALTGSKLSAKATGDESKEATNVTYQWQVSADGNTYTDIKSAAKSTFTIPDTADYVGKTIKVIAKGESESTAASEPTAAIEKSDTLKVAEAKEALQLSQAKKITKAGTIILPTAGENNTTITWASDNKSIISDGGQATLPEKEIAEVTLTATIKLGEAEETKTFTFQVWSEAAQGNQGTLDAIVASYGSVLVPEYGTDENIVAFLKADMVKRGLADPDEIEIQLKSVEKNSYPQGNGSIAGNGDLTYTYFDDYRTVSTSNKYTAYKTVFELKKGEATSNLEIQVNLYLDIEKLKTALTAAASADLTAEKIKNGNADLSSVTSELTLPKYPYLENGYSGTKWYEVSWSSSDSDIVSVKENGSADINESLYGPYRGIVKQSIEDRNVTLTATISFEAFSNTPEEAEKSKITQPFNITVKAASSELQEAMQKALDENYTLDKLTYSGTDTVIDKEAVDNDIQFLRPSKTGITDYDKYTFTVTSKDENLLNVNGYRGNLYRPLPGEPAKDVTFTVKMKHKSYNLAVTKDFTVKVKPLEQAEIDKEIRLMDAAKEAYFDGIKGKNTDKENITQNLHSFQEVIFDHDGKTLKWIYSNDDATERGVHAVDLDGADKQESWRAFRSSNSAVIKHENLVFTQPQYDEKVTIDSCLSSEVFEKYAEKYPDNAYFQKLYRQPVSVIVTAKGAKSGAKPPAQKIKVTFAMRGDSPHGASGHTEYREWLSSSMITVDEGSTVMDLFKAIADKNGYQYTGSDGYISSVTSPAGITLAQKTNGENSGWMYKVNGVISDKYANEHILKNGDVVLWYYTDDWEQEDVNWPSAVSINKASLKLAVGESQTLTADIRPVYADRKTVSWSTSNKNAVQVNGNGTVSAVGPGAATITAKTANGKTASCRITATFSAPTGVKAGAVGTTSIKVSWKKVKGAKGYEVYRAVSKKGKYKKTGTSASLICSP